MQHVVLVAVGECVQQLREFHTQISEAEQSTYDHINISYINISYQYIIYHISYINISIYQYINISIYQYINIPIRTYASMVRNIAGRGGRTGSVRGSVRQGGCALACFMNHLIWYSLSDTPVWRSRPARSWSMYSKIRKIVSQSRESRASALKDDTFSI
eukprot:SAG31_NODE_3560_length_4122_cov_6.095451_4_plen_159_part_00